MKVKITITLEGEYAEALTNDLRAFADLPPKTKEMIHDIVHANILKLRASREEVAHTNRKVLAIGTTLLRHIDSLEVTPVAE